MREKGSTFPFMHQHRVTGQEVKFSVTQSSTVSTSHTTAPQQPCATYGTIMVAVHPLSTEPSCALHCHPHQVGTYVGGRETTRGRNFLLIFSSGLMYVGFISLLQKYNFHSLVHTKWLLCTSLDSSSFLFIDTWLVFHLHGPH